MQPFRLLFFAFAAALLITSSDILAEQYDPLKAETTGLPEPIDLMVVDSNRDREIPLRVYLPTSSQPQPVVMFSHGLGGSSKNNPYLGKHWAARGYVAVFMQHAGSDESVWKDQPRLQIMSKLKAAASAQSFMDRVRDVPAVLDQLEEWNKQSAGSSQAKQLAGRLDLEHVGLSGHSFGALTTQAMSGQGYMGGRAMFTDSRIDAAVMMSPSKPKRLSAKQAFGNVKLPWLLMTGTDDGAPIGDQTPETRREVYPALPPGDKYELVLHEAEHSAFSERALPGDRKGRNPNHHRAILAISTGFWDTYLRQDPQAKAWIASDAVQQVLEQQDIWQRK